MRFEPSLVAAQNEVCPSRDQRRLYRIIKIDLLDRGMRLGTLPANAVDISAGPGRHDFLDLAEAQGRAQASREAHRLLGLTLGQLSNGEQRGMHAIDRK